MIIVDLTRCAEDILLAREAHFPATIADLYDPNNMPENLRHAHERNDEVLERIYNHIHYNAASLLRGMLHQEFSLLIKHLI